MTLPRLRAALFAAFFCSMLVLSGCSHTQTDEQFKSQLAERDSTISSLRTAKAKLERDLNDLRSTPQCGTVLCKDGACYGIQRGDTLTKISLHFYRTAKKFGAIAEANGIKNPNLIYAGACICIPGLPKRMSINVEGHSTKGDYDANAVSAHIFHDYISSTSSVPPVFPRNPELDMPTSRERIDPFRVPRPVGDHRVPGIARPQKPPD